MSSNKPFSTASSCGCGVGSEMGIYMGGSEPSSGRYWPQSDPGSATNACGNIALSPIQCSDCCGVVVDVLPPYVPSPADLLAAPVCKDI